MHGTVATVSVYLNYHMYCVCWVVFILVGELVPSSDCFFACSWWLAVADYYYYHCPSDNQQWPSTKVEEADGLPLGQSTGMDVRQFQA